MAEHDLPVSEVEVLQELQERGLHEIEGVPIEDLLSLATSRERALEILNEASEAYREGLQSEDKAEAKMQEASQKALTALEQLQKIEDKYPAFPIFSSRRQALSTDVARAEGLLEAIDTWWWQRFSQQVATFYMAVHGPGGIGKARSALNEAERILEQWPILWGRSRQRSQQTLEEMKEHLRTAQEDHTRVWVDRAESWIQWAREAIEGTSVKVNSAGSGQIDAPDRDPFVALQCLAWAEALLKQLDDVVGASDELRERMEELRYNADDIKQKCLHEAPKIMAAQRRFRVMRSLVVSLSSRIMGKNSNIDGLLSNMQDNEAQRFRHQLDELIASLYDDPSYWDIVQHWDQEPKNLIDAIYKRQDQWYHGTLLYLTARELWERGQEKRRSYIYRIYRYLSEAKELYPDPKAIEVILRDVEAEWFKLDKDVKSSLYEARCTIDEVDNILENIAVLQHDPAGAVRIDLQNVKEQLDFAESILKKTEASGKEALKTIQSQVDTCPEWEEQWQELRKRIDTANWRLKKFQDLVKFVDGLIECWNKLDGDIGYSILATRAIVQSDALPKGIRKAIARELLQVLRETLRCLRRQNVSRDQQIELTLLLWLLMWESGEASYTISHSSTLYAGGEHGRYKQQ